jgi:hypothetical protein
MAKKKPHQENTDPGKVWTAKEFAAGGIRSTRLAKVARHKEQSYEAPPVEQGRREEQARNKFASGTPK